MIRVGVFYSLTKKFDWDYYLGKHTPLVQRLLSPALRKVDIDQGVAGGGPGAPATYTTVCTLTFDWWRRSRLRSRRMPRRSWAHHQLHRCAAGGADQRGEDVARPQRTCASRHLV